MNREIAWDIERRSGSVYFESTMGSDARIQHAVETLCERIEVHHEGLDSVVDLAVLVAAADGTVDERELAAIEATVSAVFHSRMKPEVVGLLVRASAQAGTREGVAARTERLAELLRRCDAVDEGLAVALAVDRANAGASREGRAALDGLARALGVDDARLAAIADDSAAPPEPWSLPEPRPRSADDVVAAWRAAVRGRAGTPTAAWQAGVTELRTIAAAIRDSYLGVSPQREALADLVDEISKHLPERREARR